MMGAGARGVNLETLRLGGSGDVLHEVGRATITIQPEGGETDTLVVKYVVVWERDSAGGLALAVDMWNGESAGWLRLRGLLERICLNRRVVGLTPHAGTGVGRTPP